MAKYTATFKGKGAIKKFGGGKIKWIKREIDYFDVDQKKGAPINATLKLTGANWTVKALEVEAKNNNEFTKLFDLNANGGRMIGALSVGKSSDIDLQSTSIGYLLGGTGSHDVVLGSGDLDRARFEGDVTLVGGSGEIGSLRIDGMADVTIDVGGAGRVRTGGLDDSVTVGNGGEVDVIRTDNGNDSVTVQDGAQVGLVRTGSGNDTVAALTGGDIRMLRTGSGDDSVSIDNARVRNIDLGDGNNTLALDNGGKVFYAFADGGSGATNTVTLDHDSRINSLELGNSTAAVSVLNNSSISTVNVYDSTATFTLTDDGDTTKGVGVDVLTSWQSLVTVNLGANTWISAMTLNGTVTGAQQINIGDGRIGSLNSWESAVDLTLGSGNLDAAQFGASNDSVTVTTGYIQSLNTGGGDDTVDMGNGGGSFIKTDWGDDTITTGSQWIYFVKAGKYTPPSGETDNDTVTIGSGGAMTVTTEAGNDTVTTNGWVETLNAGSGDDTVTVNAGAKLIRTEAGNDTVTLGAEGASRVELGDGDDTLVLAESPNRGGMYRGDAGVDTIDFSSWSVGITFVLGLPGWQNPGAPGGDLTDDANNKGYIIESNFENVIGTGQADSITGDDADNSFTGGAGADVFTFGGSIFNIADPDAAGTDTVTDFEDGSDLLRLIGQNFAGLTIADDGGDLKITHDHGVILLSGLAGTTLTAADFLFV